MTKDEALKQTYTLSEANVNDLLGWLRAGQINRAVIALEHLNPAELAQPVQPDPLFTAPVAAKKWAALQAEGYKMQHLCFVRDGVTGTIDDWGKVLWEPVQQEPAVKAFEYVNTAAGLRFTKPEYINGVQHPVGTLFYTSPPQREWVGLTDDEMHQCFDVSGRREPVYRALEAALKEKNT